MSNANKLTKILLVDGGWRQSMPITTGRKALIKTFITGLVLGLIAAPALLYFVPAIDLDREASLISVQANGGNREIFHVNLPSDRIMAGKREGASNTVFPDNIVWPDSAVLDGAETEIFKIRNRDDIVVGVAARVSSLQDPAGPFVQWMLHLPSRGSMFANLSDSVSGDGQRDGALVAGTREFAELTGAFTESYNSDVASIDSDVSGRLELRTALVGPLGEVE